MLQSIRSMHLCRVIGLAALLVLAGCATVSGPSSQQMSQARDVQSMVAQGQYAQAARRYLALANQQQGGDYFRLRAAETWRKAGRIDQVAELLPSINASHLNRDDAARYALLQAAVALHNGHAARAATLTSMSGQSLSPPLRQRLLTLRARAQAAQKQPFAAARTRVQLDPMLNGADQAANRRQIAALLTGMGAQALQQHAATLADNSPLRRWVNAALNQLGVPAGQSAANLNNPVGTQLLGQAIEQGYKAPGNVALLLPASGPLQAAATVIRKGVFAGYFNRGGAHARDTQSALTSYDSGTTPAQAVAAYQKAVQAGATLVVGPLARDSVAAVAGQDALPVPVLALNHPDKRALPPSHMTEFGLQPGVEGAQVADHMINAGIHEAVELVSSEDFAQRAGDAFKAQFTADGGQVVTMLSLNPQQVDYRSQIRAVDWSALTQGGVFLSMRPEQARLLMPQLRLAGLKWPVFATSHVYSGRDDPDDDGDLNGVTFCDAPWLFDAQPGLPSRATIGQSLPAVNSGSGARLFALGLDAWDLTPYLAWLRGHPGSYLAGATGRLTEDGFGHLRRVLIWARFSGGIAHSLEGSLEASPPSADAPAMPTNTGNVPAAAGSSGG